MIYIFSQEAEYTTDKVMEWLNYYKMPAKRINGEDLDKKDNIFISISNKKSNTFKINNSKIINNKIGWYRRFGKPSLYKRIRDLDLNNEWAVSILECVKRDRNVLKKHLIEELDIQEWLNEPKLVNMNKINVLNLASKNGLKIPSTIICSSKRDLIEFYQFHPEIIVKSVSEVPFLSKENYFQRYLTHKLELNNFDKIPEKFAPSCFQELINKKFEIRIFYLDGKCFSMAIFSQKDKSTQVDFRNYNLKKPNRNVPYILPDKIADKIKKLMSNIGLNCGSIDMIKDNNGEYVFLEINPVGQFGMVSNPCNYYLEEKVAKSLIKKHNSYGKI